MLHTEKETNRIIVTNTIITCSYPHRRHFGIQGIVPEVRRSPRGGIHAIQAYVGVGVCRIAQSLLGVVGGRKPIAGVAAIGKGRRQSGGRKGAAGVARCKSLAGRVLGEVAPGLGAGGKRGGKGKKKRKMHTKHTKIALDSTIRHRRKLDR